MKYPWASLTNSRETMREMGIMVFRRTRYVRKMRMLLTGMFDYWSRVQFVRSYGWVRP
jgi:hypothetical protein